MTPISHAAPDTKAPTSAFTANQRRSRGRVSFWLWAVAAPLGALLMVTHNWWAI